MRTQTLQYGYYSRMAIYPNFPGVVLVLCVILKCVLTAPMLTLETLLPWILKYVLGLIIRFLNLHANLYNEKCWQHSWSQIRKKTLTALQMQILNFLLTFTFPVFQYTYKIVWLKIKCSSKVPNEYYFGDILRIKRYMCVYFIYIYVYNTYIIHLHKYINIIYVYYPKQFVYKKT